MIQVAGKEFKDPLIIASGILPYARNLMREVCVEYQPSAITLKTLTLNPLEPHKPPTVIKFHEGCYLNAIGLGNPGVKVIRDLEDIPCQLIGSVGGSSIEEYSAVARELERVSVLIELNVSSPNRAGYGISLLNYVKDIVSSVKSSIKKPVFVKLPPSENILEIAGKALEAGADGLTLINTLRGMLIDIETAKPILSYETGGISGKCIYPLALRIIREVYSEYEVDIIGTGGVFSWEDVIGMMMVGAKLVGLGSVIIEKGFNIIKEIREGLISYLKEKKLSFKDIIGIGVKK
ncbi:MAG: dihydroorotate dehydrogenase PyrD [Sulfolobaceae archaeon]